MSLDTDPMSLDTVRAAFAEFTLTTEPDLFEPDQDDDQQPPPPKPDGRIVRHKHKRSPVRDRSDAFWKVLGMHCDTLHKEDAKGLYLDADDQVSLANDYNVRTRDVHQAWLATDVSQQRVPGTYEYAMVPFQKPTAAERALAEREMEALRRLAPIRKLIAIANEPVMFDSRDLQDAAESIASTVAAHPGLALTLQKLALVLDIAEQMIALSNEARAELYGLYEQLVDQDPQFFKTLVINYDRGDKRQQHVQSIYPFKLNRWNKIGSAIDDENEESAS